MNSQINKVVEKVKELPSLSPTVAKVVEVSNDMNASPRELVTVIKMDPILTGKVLKLVNSAYFSLPQDVTSLERAIIMLGLNTIKNLTLSTAVIGQFDKKVKCAFNMDEFWSHSLSVAVGSKIVSILLNIPKRNREEFFIAGLLHDIGKVYFAQFFSDSMDFILKRVEADQIPIVRAEFDEIKVTHPEIGVHIAKEWKLSGLLQKAIAFHHGPNLEDKALPLTGAVYIANIMCNNMKLGSSGEVVEMEILDKIWEKLKIDKQKCKEMFENIGPEIEKAKAFLKV